MSAAQVSGAQVIAEFPVTCVYCGRRTGISHEPDRKTVCYACQWGAPGRDEAKEIAAGMRPLGQAAQFLGPLLRVASPPRRRGGDRAGQVGPAAGRDRDQK